MVKYCRRVADNIYTSILGTGIFFHLIGKCQIVGRKFPGAVAGLETATEAIGDDTENSVEASEITLAAAATLHKYEVFINYRGPDVQLTFRP